MKHNIQIANALRLIARYGLLFLGITAFGFALISGSESFGGGLMGVFKNSPNALPWLILLGVIAYAWKNELYGGISITVLGVAAVIAFNFIGPRFFIETFILTSLIPTFGGFLLFSWYLRKPNLKKND